MNEPGWTRRRMLIAGAVGAVAVRQAIGAQSASDATEDVSAMEDLMREHGLLRRMLCVYRAARERLQHDAANTTLEPVHRTARLFRTFGEDYHERMLEEQIIFPAVVRAGPPKAAHPDVLTAQHRQGRAITDYLYSASAHPDRARESVSELIQGLSYFVRLYDAHTAFEETLVFPAWRKLLKPDQYAEMSERFEEIERKQFGGDGYAATAKEVAAIEQVYDIGNVAAWDAPKTYVGTSPGGHETTDAQAGRQEPGTNPADPSVHPPQAR